MFPKYCEMFLKHTLINVIKLNLNSLWFVLNISLFLLLPNIIDAKPLKSAVSAENISGFHVKIINHISTEAGLEINILKVPLARRIQMISSGQLDLLVGLRKTPQRENHFIFIEPSYTVGESVSAFYINSTLVNSLDDTKTKKLIAVTNKASYIKDYNLPFDFELIEVPTLKQLILMLKKGRVDAFIYGHKKTNIALKAFNISNIKASKRIKPQNSKKAPSYIVISKSSTLIDDIDKLSRISKKLRQGKYRELHDQYYQNNSKAN